MNTPTISIITFLNTLMYECTVRNIKSEKHTFVVRFVFMGKYIACLVHCVPRFSSPLMEKAEKKKNSIAC